MLKPTTCCAVFLALFLSSRPTLAQWNEELYAAASIPTDLLKNAHDVVRREVIDFEVKNLREGVLRHHKIVTLLTNDSDASKLFVPYDKDTRVEKMTAKLYDAQGKLIRKLERDEITDNAAVDGFSIYNDARYKYVELHHPLLPYTVEFEVELSLKGIYYAVFPDWEIQQYHNAVQFSQFNISLPAQLRFYHQMLNIELGPAQTTQTPDARSYSWTVTNLPAIREEPYSPPPSEVLPTLLCSPHEFEIGNYIGSMASWKDYGAFMNSLYARRDVLPAALADEVKQIAAQHGDTPAKIAALYQYMQRKVRYVSVQLGIGGWQPFDATYVSENSYGDCKALTNFMKAILGAVGIEAWPALIKAGELDYEVKEGFTYPSFNHVILYVPEADIWLECTSNTAPPNYLGSGSLDRNVLLVTPQGGRLARTPASLPEHNVGTGLTHLRVEPDGKATIQYKGQFTGELHEDLRYMSTYASAEEKERWLRSSSALPACNLQGFVQQASPAKPEASMSYQAEALRYASRAGKRMFIPVNVVNPFRDLPPRSTERKQPIVLADAYTEMDTFILSLPAAFAVESYMQEAFSLESSFGSYQLRMEKSDEAIRVYRYLQLRPARLPAEEYEVFRRFFVEVAKCDGQKIVCIQQP